MNFKHHIRIKILNKEALEEGNIEIPYFSSANLKGLKAATYNLVDGKVVVSELEKSAIHKENSSKYITTKKFSLPDVSVGSIIEYKFETQMGSFLRLNTWYFQKEYPVLHSEYWVDYPSSIEYKKIVTGYIAMNDVVSEAINKPYGKAMREMWTAKNIPAFIEEPYLASKSDYISKIQFEIASINVPGRPSVNYSPKSYESFSRKLAQNEEFLSELNKSNYYKKDLAALVEGMEKSDQPLAIYQFIQKRMKYDSEDESNSPKEAYVNKTGNVRSINLILCSMLKKQGFEAYPVMLSTRRQGRLHPFYPIVSQMNYFIVLLKVDDKEFLLDATNDNLPFGIIPRKALNDKGLVISNNDLVWVDLKTPIRDMRSTTSLLTIEDGTLHGTVTQTFKGYEAIGKNATFNKDGEEKYLEDLIEDYDDLNIEEFSVLDYNQESVTMKQRSTLNVENAVEDIGNLIYIKACPLWAMEESPFKLEERVYPVDFNVPFTHVNIFNITVPEGFTTDELPKPISIALPNKAGNFVYNVQQNGNSIQIYVKQSMNKSVFNAEEYPMLKAFYAQLISKQNEQIVLKKI